MQVTKCLIAFVLNGLVEMIARGMAFASHIILNARIRTCFDPFGISSLPLEMRLTQFDLIDLLCWLRSFPDLT